MNTRHFQKILFSIIFSLLVLCAQAYEYNSNSSFYSIQNLNNNNTQIDDKTLMEFLDYANKNPENKAAVDEALNNNNKEMCNFIMQEIVAEKELEYQKKLQEETSEKYTQKQQKREYYKKCFLSNDEFMKNYFAYNRRDNAAFAFGLINPINLVTAIIYSPIYFCLWSLGQL